MRRHRSAAAIPKIWKYDELLIRNTKGEKARRSSGKGGRQRERRAREREWREEDEREGGRGERVRGNQGGVDGHRKVYGHEKLLSRQAPGRSVRTR